MNAGVALALLAMAQLGGAAGVAEPTALYRVDRPAVVPRTGDKQNRPGEVDRGPPSPNPTSRVTRRVNLVLRFARLASSARSTVAALVADRGRRWPGGHRLDPGQRLAEPGGKALRLGVALVAGSVRSGRGVHPGGPHHVADVEGVRARRAAEARKVTGVRSRAQTLLDSSPVPGGAHPVLVGLVPGEPRRTSRCRCQRLSRPRRALAARPVPASGAAGGTAGATAAAPGRAARPLAGRRPGPPRPARR